MPKHAHAAHVHIHHFHVESIESSHAGISFPQKHNLRFDYSIAVIVCQYKNFNLPY